MLAGRYRRGVTSFFVRLYIMQSSEHCRVREPMVGGASLEKRNERKCR
jgi:hypothetical protein